MDQHEKIMRYENRLLRNEESWRRARIGAYFLGIMAFLMLVIHTVPLSSEDPLTEFHDYLIIGVVFWVVIIDWVTLRLRHIDSIHYYRNQGTQKEQGEQREPTLVKI